MPGREIPPRKYPRQESWSKEMTSAGTYPEENPFHEKPLAGKSLEENASRSKWLKGENHFKRMP